MSTLTYQLETDLKEEEFVDVLQRSGLAERRPVDNTQCIAGMLKNADVIVTVRNQDNFLVGVSRAITDFSYCTYLSDLAVDQTYQKQGIGKRLIEETHKQAGRNTTLILLAAPAARQYYPRIGMESHDSCWITPGATE